MIPRKKVNDHFFIYCHCQEEYWGKKVILPRVSLVQQKCVAVSTFGGNMTQIRVSPPSIEKSPAFVCADPTLYWRLF